MSAGACLLALLLYQTRELAFLVTEGLLGKMPRLTLRSHTPSGGARACGEDRDLVSRRRQTRLGPPHKYFVDQRRYMAFPTARILALASAVFMIVFLISCTWSEPPSAADRPPESAEPTQAPPRPTEGDQGKPGGAPEPTRSAEPTQAPSPTTAPSRGSEPPRQPGDDELSDFVRSCQEESRFRRGQVDYPRTLRMRMGEAVTYAAAVDVRDDPLPSGKVIDADDPGSDPIYVQCVVGARLVSVGGGIDVDVADSSDGGWKYQEFTPKGELKWAWTVTARSPADQELRIELRPAARESQVIRNANTSASYVTRVTVDASLIGRSWYWLQTEGNLLKAIFISLGAAVLAILAFSAKVREGLPKVFGRNPESKTSRSRAGDQVGGTAKKPKKATGSRTRAQGKRGQNTTKPRRSSQT